MENIKTDKSMIIQGEGYRISLLTDRLIRLEYSKKNIFTDAATQTVLNRKFDEFEFRVESAEKNLTIITKYLRLNYDERPFSKEGLKINIAGNALTTSGIWHYGDTNESLKGTARTLDGVNGEIPLGDGIISWNLWSVLDDSSSMLLTDKGFEHRDDEEAKDIYFFGYGTDYLAAVKDFYRLSGSVPLLPRYALGNWWSRYYKYTRESYKALIDRFNAENIPFNVAVLDMDWHITEVDAKYGTGWTGYTWNRELFDDPKEFLEELHENNYKVTLNVHPADGIRAFEDVYPEFAEFMEIDVKNEDPILFDIADSKFREGYFKYVHHKLEADGVDFWWLDWQQGSNSGVKGLDPLWLLNHFHYIDAKKDGKRGLILSRYAGPGSHRYPVGFSGDTVISWESLDFQPYFTSTASNIGYGWWSHDIGGHMNGVRDDELFTRWVQFGVFSPIMRLHSTSNEFLGKEPWNYNPITEKVVKRYLRLRQRLIPYLYTMNLRANREGIPLILPLYYYDSEKFVAYKYRNEYYFGENLLVCPITEKNEVSSCMAKSKMYLPDGEWVDIFTGVKYKGGREIEIYRDIDNIGVFAKLGTILPLDSRRTGNEINNPEKMDLYVFTGACGEFTLAEDNAELSEFDKADWRYTEFKNELVNNDSIDEKEYIFTISKADGIISDGISERKYNLHFYGIREFEFLHIESGDKTIEPIETNYDTDRNVLIISLPYISLEDDIIVKIKAVSVYNSNEILENKIFNLLNKAQIYNDVKGEIFESVKKLEKNGHTFVLGEVCSICNSQYVKGAITELLTA